MRTVYDIPVEAAAARLGVHPETIRRYCRGQKVPAVTVVSGKPT